MIRLLLLPALLFFHPLHAQHFAWMRPLPTSCNALAVDARGNVLVQTDRDIVFPGASHQLRLLNPAGETLWIIDMPNALAPMTPAKTDPQGNFYFPVQGAGSVAIDGVSHTFDPDNPHALAKLRPDGMFEWFRYDTDYLSDFELDSQGNVYTAGRILLRKWDAAGNALWEIPAPHFASFGTPAGYPLDVDVVTDDRIVVAGKLQYAFGQNIELADTVLNLNEEEAVFLMAFDPAGKRQWLKVGTTYYAPVWHAGVLAHDQQGMLYFGFNPFSLKWDGLQLPPAGGQLGPALFKIAAADGQQIWAQHYPEWSWLQYLAASPGGALFLAGELRNQDDPDGEIVVGGIHHPRQLNYQAYAARFSTDGVPQWLAVSNDADGAHFDRIACGPQGHVWVSGLRGFAPSFGETRYGSERLFLGANGSGAVGLLIDSLAAKPAPAAVVQGTVFDDAQPDCLQGPAEPGFEGFTLVAEPGPFLVKTDASGHFALPLPPGTYTLRPVEHLHHAQRLTLSCTPAHAFALPSGSPNLDGLDFPLNLESCTALAASFDVEWGVHCVGEVPTASIDSFLDIGIVYGNFGAAALAQTDLYIDFPPEFYPVSSTPLGWTAFNTADSSLLYSFSNIPARSRDTLYVRLAFDCAKSFSGGIQPPALFPFSAKFTGATNSCYPEDSVLTRLAWEVQYFIPVGTSTPTREPRFRVSPNPSADGIFRVKNEMAGPVLWEVSDALGHPIHGFTSAEATVEIDLHDAPAGMYYLCGRTGNGVWSARLVRW